MQGVVGLRRYDPRRLAAVAQPHRPSPDRADVVYGNRNGKRLLAAHRLRLHLAGRYEQLRLFYLLPGDFIGVGRGLAVGYGHIYGEGLAGLLARHVQIVRPQLHRIGSVIPLHQKGDLQAKDVFPIPCDGLAVIPVNKGAVLQFPQIGRDGHPVIVGLAQQGQHDIYPAVEDGGHIPLGIGEGHAGVQGMAVDGQLARHRLGRGGRGRPVGVLAVGDGHLDGEGLGIGCAAGVRIGAAEFHRVNAVLPVRLERQVQGHREDPRIRGPAYVEFVISIGKRAVRPGVEYRGDPQRR